MLEQLRRLMALYLVMGVGGEGEGSGSGDGGAGETPPGDTDATTADDAATDDDSAILDDLIEDPPAPADDDAGTENKTVRELRRRAQEAEDRERAARREVDDMRQRQAPPPQDYEAELRKREDAELEAARGRGQADYEWAKWRVEQNRTIRATDARSQAALQTAADMRDQAAFDKVLLALEKRKPGSSEKWAKKVEDTVTDLRRQGKQIPERAVMLKYLIGEASLSSPTKARAKTSTAKAAATAPRGTTVSSRSDRTGRGTASDREKRAARLKDVII